MRAVLISVLLLAMASVPARGFDPRGIDIIGFRLAMTEAEVMAQLDRQGFVDEAFQRHDAPCPADPAQRCLTRIDARSRDGALAFHFSADQPPRLIRLTYTIEVRGPNGSAGLERSVLGRFGPPTTTGPPMAWCQRTGTPRSCPPGMPRLTFAELNSRFRMLTLTLQ